MRVWLSYIQAPGLAMSRSMGDKVGAQAGVTADPEILNFPITNQDQFIIVASDGVWEYLSNEDVMSMVIPYVEKENPDQAAERVVAESIQAWRRVYSNVRVEQSSQRRYYLHCGVPAKVRLIYIFYGFQLYNYKSIDF